MTKSKDRPRLSRAAAEFLVHCRVGKTISEHSLRAYRIDLADFARFLESDRRVASIGREDLRGFLGYLSGPRRLKPASVKRRIACLKAFFRWLELEEAVEITPFHRLDLRIRLPRRLPRGLSQPEMAALLDVARRPFASQTGRLAFAGCDADPTRFDALTGLVAVDLLYASAVRVAELCALQADAVAAAGPAGLTVHGKGNRERWVPLTTEATQTLLSTYLKARNAWTARATATGALPPRSLLIDDRAVPQTPPAIRRRLAALARQAGIERPVTPHMLRHTAATHLLQAGLDLRHTQRLLGHSSVSTTEIYTAVTDQSLEAAMRRVVG